ncbi:MAG: VOC family protein [Alphaproteobacteria bacterium]|nr:VOC family protein [Alphaproteobacteria bacterium]
MKEHLTTPLTPELACSNIKASLNFYVQILGFTIQYQREEDGFAMLERQGSRIMLDEIRETSVTGTDRTWFVAPLEKPFGRGINLQMETSDVDDLYAKVQVSGVRIFLPMEETWYRKDDMLLGNRQFIVQDPDGYLLRFFQDLGSKPA